MIFRNIKTIDELFKKADGMTTFYKIKIGYPYTDEYENEIPTFYNSIESAYNAAINLTKERFGNKFSDSIKKSIQDVEKELLTEGRSNVVVGEEELIDEEYGEIASYAVIDKVTVNIVK